MASVLSSLSINKYFIVPNVTNGLGNLKLIAYLDANINLKLIWRTNAHTYIGKQHNIVYIVTNMFVSVT
jgi:hypothetical protein